MRAESIILPWWNIYLRSNDGIIYQLLNKARISWKKNYLSWKFVRIFLAGTFQLITKEKFSNISHQLVADFFYIEHWGLDASGKMTLVFRRICHSDANQKLRISNLFTLHFVHVISIFLTIFVHFRRFRTLIAYLLNDKFLKEK